MFVDMVCSSQEFMDRDRNTIHNYFENGKCSECGQCCGDKLPMSYEEVAIIQKYVARNHIEARERTPLVLATPRADLMCPFLDESKSEHKCKIYEVRPRVCREFTCENPYWVPSERFIAEYERGNIKNYNVRETFFGK